jgi:hypothetical protein
VSSGVVALNNSTGRREAVRAGPRRTEMGTRSVTGPLLVGRMGQSWRLCRRWRQGQSWTKTCYSSFFM